MVFSKSSFTLGNFRAIYLVFLCCIGSFLFAYDTGIVGGVLTLASFEKDFRYSKKAATNVNSNCVSILQAGAFFGCFLIWPITARFGRRLSIVLSSLVFCLGGILQVVNTHSIGCFYAGRIISGFGVGAATVLVPMFSAEMAPKNMRGQLGSCFQLFFALGVCTSYWVNYGVQKHIKSSTLQWQVPIGLQLVPGGILGLGMLLVKESVRWLAKKGRNDEAWNNLVWVRGGDGPEVQAEFEEIQQGLEEEFRATEGVTWKELLLPANRFRVFVIISMQLGVQLTGNTSLAYYAPQIFAAVGAGQSTLLVTGFFGVVKVVAVSTFCLFIVGRIGRKTAFMGGAAAMGSFMLAIAIIVAKDPPSGKITSPAIAAIIMVYAEAASYNFSWGPVSWLYMGEIFPTRIREFGIAIGAAAQWLFNFMLSQITPHAVKNLGWKTFLMFSIFNYALVVYAFFVLKETQGKSLEEMEAVFGSRETAVDSEAIRAKIERQANGKANAEYEVAHVN
ncbi:related to quinate transport protein [Phialocephala subalpina]|uniref:Related to quinate transport protein n=1 Tax=Phialocephala subalpina TaxID=576137 RepID=A0A1L7XGD2_9HELO|nr:related to quinate transport protein [Phialocephala subalpina]